MAEEVILQQDVVVDTREWTVLEVLADSLICGRGKDLGGERIRIPVASALLRRRPTRPPANGAAVGLTIRHIGRNDDLAVVEGTYTDTDGPEPRVYGILRAVNHRNHSDRFDLGAIYAWPLDDPDLVVVASPPPPGRPPCV